MSEADIWQIPELQIKKALDLINAVLGESTLGVYLYGSATLGGLQKNSDIDFLAVSSRPTTKIEKKALVERLLEISIDDPKLSLRSIELTIVVKSQINPWKYPPSLDFQYGEWMRKDFEKGNIEPRDSNVEEDLAISITQTLLTGRTLQGQPPEALLPHVPYGDFMMATAAEIGDIMVELEDDTRNALLTLTRIWATLATGTISAKQDAAIWAMTRLPSRFQPVIRHARDVSIDKIDENWSNLEPLIKPCADFMVEEIQKLRQKSNLNDVGKSIIVLSKHAN